MDDFRHALWLWNDEDPEGPWEEMLAQWKEHPLNTATAPNDTLQHPLYVVRLQATGRIARLDLTVLSNSMHHLDINLQQQTFATTPPYSIQHDIDARNIDAPVQNELFDTEIESSSLQLFSPGRNDADRCLPACQFQHSALYRQAVVQPSGNCVPQR